MAPNDLLAHKRKHSAVTFCPTGDDDTQVWKKATQYGDNFFCCIRPPAGRLDEQVSWATFRITGQLNEIRVITGSNLSTGIVGDGKVGQHRAARALLDVTDKKLPDVPVFFGDPKKWSLPRQALRSGELFGGTGGRPAGGGVGLIHDLRSSHRASFL